MGNRVTATSFPRPAQLILVLWMTTDGFIVATKLSIDEKYAQIQMDKHQQRQQQIPHNNYMTAKEK